MLSLINEMLMPIIYQADQKKLSNSQISHGSTTEFMAGQCFELIPGFAVSLGATFEVTMNGCSLE